MRCSDHQMFSGNVWMFPNMLLLSPSTRWRHSSQSTVWPASISRLRPTIDGEPQSRHVVQTGGGERRGGNSGLPAHVDPTV